MTYEEGLAKQAEMYAAVDVASKALKAFPREPNGLTPDAVKQTPEYQEAKRAYSRAFEGLRNFNAAFLKAYPRRQRPNGPKEAGMDRNEMLGWVRGNCKFAKTTKLASNPLFDSLMMRLETMGRGSDSGLSGPDFKRAWEVASKELAPKGIQVPPFESPQGQEMMKELTDGLMAKGLNVQSPYAKGVNDATNQFMDSKPFGGRPGSTGPSRPQQPGVPQGTPAKAPWIKGKPTSPAPTAIPQI